MTRKFSDVVSAFCKKTPDLVDLKCVTITRDLFREIIYRTPVSTGDHKGRLVGNWNVKLNGFDMTVGNNFSPQRSGPIRRMEAIIKRGIFYGDDVYVTMSNATHYAYRAEYLGWPYGEGEGGWKWSGKVGPYAMVRTSIQIISAKY